MAYGILADVLILFHLSFIIFVMTGGFLAIKWRWVMFLHLPCAFWGAIVEIMGWYCPLSPYEQKFRQLGTESGYSGELVESFIVPLVYPPDLTRDIQIIMGISVIFVNLLAYGWIIFNRKAPQQQK